ncbi:MAG: hypothetical protein HRT71_00075 [Flavobacteriales bacterium]|nr:hypothetical protein [Flavobacteriales bacterium]
MLKTGISSIKKITTGLVAVLISTYCLGQGLNVELGINSAYDQQPKSKIVYIDEFTYLLVHYDEESNSLQKLDTNGNVLWQVIPG